MHNGVFLYIGVSIQGVSEKVHSWKKFTKVRRARNLRKLPVSLCTLTFSGTSSTKILFKMLVFSSRKAVTNPSPPPKKKPLRTKIFNWKQNLITQSHNMDCRAQGMKVSRNLVHA